MKLPPFRHYLYISEAKVRMYFPQLPPKVQRTVAAEIGFDLAVLHGKVSTEREAGQPSESIVQLCRIIERYLQKEGMVADLPSVKPWVCGTFTARSFSLENTGTMFVGRIESTLLALVGSTGHLVGYKGESSSSCGLSFGPHILEKLANLAETDSSLGSPPATSEKYVESGVTQSLHPSWVRVIRDVDQNMVQPEQKLDFLARRLFSYSEVVLCTPLFVALSDA